MSVMSVISAGFPEVSRLVSDQGLAAPKESSGGEESRLCFGLVNNATTIRNAQMPPPSVCHQVTRQVIPSYRHTAMLVLARQNSSNARRALIAWAVPYFGRGSSSDRRPAASGFSSFSAAHLHPLHDSAVRNRGNEPGQGLTVCYAFHCCTARDRPPEQRSRRNARAHQPGRG